MGTATEDIALDLRTLVENLPGNIVRRVLHADGRFTYAYLSHGLSETFRMDPAEITASQDVDFHWIHADDREAFRAALLQSARDMTTLDIENRVIGKDGVLRWVRSIARPRPGPDGSVIWDGVALDATEKRRAEDEMRAAVARAEAADAAKSRFLAAASHDLRQPLQAMRFHLGAIEHLVTDPRAARSLGHLRDCLGSMQDLLGSLLDVSRLDAGVVAPQPEAVALTALAGRLGAEFAGLARDRGIALTLDAGAGAVLTDPALAGTVLRNLLQNALRFTPDGGRVALRLRRRGGRLVALVADSGPGIAPAHRTRIFEPFARIGTPAQDGATGLGLGLAIVARLTALLGGRVGLRSRPGKGSAFRVVLPAPAMPLPPARPEPADRAAPLDGLRVLMVEDDPPVAAALAGLLDLWGCTVTPCTRAREAEAALAAAAPQVVITDFRLAGGRTGLDLLRVLRAQAGASFGGIVLTGEGDRDSLRAIGAEGFLTLHKPVAPARLRAAIQTALREGRA
jgi:signal transduction histidine kinase/CheY-like chemotaxis protein